MPRNGAGFYSLPAGNPVVDGTIISTTWANPTMEDIAYQLNGVVTRDGLLAPSAPLKVVDGSVTNPGLAFGTASGTGLYKTATAAGYSYAGASYWSAGSSGMNLLGFQLAAGAPTGAGVIGSLLVGGSNINPLAALDVQSTTKAFKLPVMTTAQKTAIGNSAGLVVFDTTLGMISVNNGSAWAENGGGGGSGGTAADITNVPFGSISATNVQAAINELDTEKMPMVAPGTAGNFLRSTGTGWASQPFSYTFDGNVPGNLTFTAAGARIIGNFSDTVNSANRVMFKSAAAGNPTYVSTLPSAGGSGGGFITFSTESVTSSAYAFMGSTSTASQFGGGRTGAAAFLPVVFYAGGDKTMTMDLVGNVNIGDGRAYDGQTRTLTIINPSSAASSHAGLILDAQGTTGDCRITQLASGEMTITNSNAGATGSVYIQADGGQSRAIFSTAGVSLIGTVAIGQLGANNFSQMTMYSSTQTRLQQCSAGNIGWGQGTSTTWAAYSTTTGNFVVAGTLSQGSDERLKKDWAPLAPDFLDQLAEVKCGTYTLISNGERGVGVSAQSLQPVMPEAVSVSDLEDPNGGENMLAVNYGNAALAACIELAKEVKLLRARVQQLEGLL